MFLPNVTVSEKPGSSTDILRKNLTQKVRAVVSFPRSVLCYILPLPCIRAVFLRTVHQCDLWILLQREFQTSINPYFLSKVLLCIEISKASSRVVGKVMLTSCQQPGNIFCQDFTTLRELCDLKNVSSENVPPTLFVRQVLGWAHRSPSHVALENGSSFLLSLK